MKTVFRLVATDCNYGLVKSLVLMNLKQKYWKFFAFGLSFFRQSLMNFDTQFVNFSLAGNGKIWTLYPGNTKGGSFTVPLASCLTGLD